MTRTRRDFLAHGAIAGAGFIVSTASSASAVRALFQGVPRRRSLTGMALDDPIISAWRDAVEQMQTKLPSSNPFNWTRLAEIHGTPTAFNKCPHGNWYFLPWHRAYLTMYERKVRELTGLAGFAMPYWDWTNSPALPDAFARPTYNGKKNYLYVSARTLRGPIPAQFVGPAVITKIMGESPYETFGTTRPRGQNSLDPKWITTRTGAQGTLEGTPHNNVHNLLGGYMPGTQSPLDPIFMMHHGNLDRLWAAWNAAGHGNSPDSLWTDMPFTNNFWNNNGTPWSPKVSDLYVPENLGYTYGLTQTSTRLQAARRPLQMRVERLFAMPPSAAAPEGTQMFRAAVQTRATAARPLQVPVTVAPTALARLAAWDGPAAGEELLGLTQDRVDDAQLPRVIAVIRNITYTGERNTHFRVFLNVRNLSQATPITDPGYVGTFAFVGGSEHAEHDGQRPSVVVDLTDAIGRLHAPGTPLPGQLTVQLLPVPLPGRAPQSAGVVQPEAIEVSVVQS